MKMTSGKFLLILAFVVTVAIMIGMCSEAEACNKVEVAHLFVG